MHWLVKKHNCMCLEAVLRKVRRIARCFWSRQSICLTCCCTFHSRSSFPLPGLIARRLRPDDSPTIDLSALLPDSCPAPARLLPGSCPTPPRPSRGLTAPVMLPRLPSWPSSSAEYVPMTRDGKQPVSRCPPPRLTAALDTSSQIPHPPPAPIDPPPHPRRTPRRALPLFPLRLHSAACPAALLPSPLAPTSTDHAHTTR